MPDTLPKKKSAEVDARYTEENQTLKYKPKNDKKDKIEVEIGDSKSPKDFIPQVKLMRWSNETNFSIRLPDIPGAASVKTSYDGEKIIWEKSGFKAVFYDHPTASDEGGYEFEMHLPSKPPTNTITFTIKTKNLDFIPQQDGSIAVYHSFNKNNNPHRNYGAGKAFHIRRPHCIDSDGNDAYADMVINAASETFTITIPQSFLNTSTYPVVVDPTVGYLSAGASTFSTANILGLARHEVSESGDITKLTASLASSPTGGKYKGLIYDDSSAYPNDLQKTANEETLGSATQSWVDLTLPSNLAVLGGSTYWIGGVHDSSSVRLYQDTGGASNQRRSIVDSYSSPSDPAPALMSSSTNILSIYATITPEYYVNDDFNRADSDSLGADWTEDDTDWDIVSNTAQSTTSNQAIATWNNWGGTEDYTVEATCSVSGSSGVGVIARFQDTSNFYYCRVNTNSQNFQLRKVVSGSDTQIGSTYSAGQSSGTTYNIKLVVSGTTIEAYQDGVLRCSGTDSDITDAGTPGIWTDYSYATVDDFYAYGEEAVQALSINMTGFVDSPVQII